MALNVYAKSRMFEYQGGTSTTLLSTSTGLQDSFYIIQSMYVSRANYYGGVNQGKPLGFFNIEIRYNSVWYPIYRFAMEYFALEGAKGLDGFSQGGTGTPAEMGYARSVVSKDNPIYMGYGAAIRGNYNGPDTGRISLSISYIEMQPTTSASITGAWYL
jgi:hypothetical protein